MGSKNIILLASIFTLHLQLLFAQSSVGVANESGRYSLQYPRKEVAVINSGYAEARPLISKDGNTLYFSRRYHPENMKGEKDFQDVWVSYRDTLSENWSEPANLGPVINNKKRNAIACLSPDGMDAVFFNTYKKTRKMPLVRSRKTGNSWTRPKVMHIENYVNISDYADFFIDFENKVMFLAVEADSTMGDQDLYVSFLDPYGGWKEPINLGDRINTEFSEFAPFMGADGRSLFFCSYGHKGLGGSDIYMSVRLDDSWLNWSDPVNLGPSVNTPEEETYFSITGDFKYLYYTSYHLKARDRNILRVELPEDFTGISGPLLAQLDSVSLAPLLLSGVYNAEELGGRRTFHSGNPLLPKEKEESLVLAVSIVENPFDQVVAQEIEKALKEDLSPSMVAAEHGSRNEPENSAGNLSAAGQEMKDYLEKALPDVKFEVSQKPDTVEFKVVQNLLYEFNSVFVSPDYLSRLSKMARVLRDKPELKVQLIGYTDNVGEEEVNKRVARQRVENLVIYFRDRKVDQERIEIMGAGQANPLASNEDEEGRIQNRRVETIIRFIEK